jgi:hypothetical protein
MKDNEKIRLLLEYKNGDESLAEYTYKDMGEYDDSYFVTGYGAVYVGNIKDLIQELFDNDRYLVKVTRLGKEYKRNDKSR